MVYLTKKLPPSHIPIWGSIMTLVTQLTFIRTEPIGLTDPNKTVWWEVDLGNVYNIYSINIQFKKYDGEGV